MWKRPQKRKKQKEKLRNGKRRKKAFSHCTKLKGRQLLGNAQHVNAAVQDILWRIMAIDTRVVTVVLRGINTLKWHNAFLKCDGLND